MGTPLKIRTGKVSRVEQQKKDPDRVSIYIDDKFWVGISLNQFAEVGLRAGDQIDQARAEEILAIVDFDRALNYAYRRLSMGMISESILRQRLSERGHGKVVSEKVVQRCAELQILNDAYLAEMIVEGARADHRGRSWVARRLREKGISDFLAEAALEAGFSSDIDDPAGPVEAALENWLGERQLDRRDQQRWISRLVRRGFDPGLSREAVSARAISEQAEEELHGIDEAREFIRRRYRQIDSSNYQKVVAALLRRHFLPEIAREAVRLEQVAAQKRD